MGTSLYVLLVVLLTCAGKHTIGCHPPVARGVYFYRIEVSAAGSGGRSFSCTRRMILLR